MDIRMDLNSDLGEGFGAWRLGDDEALLRIVTSANVACGYHAGDALTMRRVCDQAADRGVAIGAQVGYRDLAGFGRRRIEYDPSELRDEVIYQIAALDGFCRIHGTRVGYVKPHGALYHAAAEDVYQASAIVRAVLDYEPSLAILCLPGTILARIALDNEVRVVTEGFADRAYQPDGRLVPRTAPGAVLSDVDLVVERAVRMALHGEVVATDGSLVKSPIESLCVHGDTPGAVGLAQRIRDALAESGILLRPFVG